MMIVGIFFPEHPGTVLFLLYLFGMLMAVLTARLMRRFMFREQEAPFVMELSPYRVPTAKTTLRHMWSKCSEYLKKMGGLILIASIVVWLLSYYPRPEASGAEAETTNYEQSYMGEIGKVAEPLFAPMDMGWQSSVAVISGIPAKEIVVSTMNVLYAEPGDEEPESDEELSATATNRMANSMSIPTAVAFLIFSLLYLPCVATIMAIGSELSWRWAVGSALYNTAVAWLLAWIGYHIALLLI
jgi:ferrous iron transport protein B